QPAVTLRVQGGLVRESEIVDSALVPCARARALRKLEASQLAGFQVPDPERLLPLAEVERRGHPASARGDGRRAEQGVLGESLELPGRGTVHGYDKGPILVPHGEQVLPPPIEREAKRRELLWKVQ